MRSHVYSFARLREHGAVSFARVFSFSLYLVGPLRHIHGRRTRSSRRIFEGKKSCANQRAVYVDRLVSFPFDRDQRKLPPPKYNAVYDTVYRGFREANLQRANTEIIAARRTRRSTSRTSRGRSLLIRLISNKSARSFIAVRVFIPRPIPARKESFLLSHCSPVCFLACPPSKVARNNFFHSSALSFYSFVRSLARSSSRSRLFFLLSWLPPVSSLVDMMVLITVVQFSGGLLNLEFLETFSFSSQIKIPKPARFIISFCFSFDAETFIEIMK